MTTLDLGKAFNALSDVVVNRPPPLREFDQIYMKISDMLLQAELLSRWVNGRSVVFLGDGDAIGLTLVHLQKEEIFDRGPSKVHVLDFDERIVNSIRSFAEKYDVEDKITAELYNVFDPLPENHIASFDAFYTNPPFGASNGGRSVEAFVRRGDEALASDGMSCIVVADDPNFSWTREVMKQVQCFLFKNNYIITELVPRFHHYHLDDAPELASCSLLATKDGSNGAKTSSAPLLRSDLENFYGACAPQTYRYVRDLRNGGKLASKDYELEPLA